MDTESSAALELEIGRINQERARLVTDQPFGWMDQYAVQQEKLKTVTERWMAAKERESHGS
jgi:hypothetical protein